MLTLASNNDQETACVMDRTEEPDGSTLLLRFRNQFRRFTQTVRQSGHGLKIIVLLIGGALDVAACGRVGPKGDMRRQVACQRLATDSSDQVVPFFHFPSLSPPPPYSGDSTPAKSGFPVPTDDLGIRSICELSYGSFFPRHGNGKVAARGGKGRRGRSSRF